MRDGNLPLLLIIALLVGMIWTVELRREKDSMEIHARINAIEATVEPLAYDSVDYDNRLAKLEGKKRFEESTEEGK